MTDTPTIGIVSPGHMGAGLGWALRAGGARVVTTIAGRSPRTARLAGEAGLELLPNLADVVAQAAIVLVVTPPGEAIMAAASIAEAATRTGARPLIADLNAVAPSTVDEITTKLKPLDLVDGAISGPPPTVPPGPGRLTADSAPLRPLTAGAPPGARIYLSGARAAEVAALPWQQVIPILVDGSASAVKMCTASVYKGLTGLYAQAMRVAAAHGVLDHVLADLRGAGFDHVASVAVAATKADRYVPEMLEIAATQRAAGLPGELFEAFARVYAEIATSPLAAQDPESVDRTMSPAEVVTAITPR